MTDQEREVTEQDKLTGDAPASARVEVPDAASSPADSAVPVDAPIAAADSDAAGAGAAPGDSTQGEGASYVAPAQEADSRPRTITDLVAGMEFDGRVKSVRPYGIFVDIGVGRDGLVHISEMSDTRIDAPNREVGEAVRVRVKSIDLEASKISLTMRTSAGVVAEADGSAPRGIRDLAPGMEFDGRVKSVRDYGIFVDIGVGRDGLVHISEMSDTHIEAPNRAVGEAVRVRVKSIDLEASKISLTMRSQNRSSGPRDRGPRRKPEVNRELLTTLRPNDMVEGVITDIPHFGAFVDIGAGKDGLVHVSELSDTRVERPSDVVKRGERYTFRVLEIDADGARISLSLRRAQRGQRLQQLEVGSIVEGTVSGIAPFGFFVDVGVGRDGLVHNTEKLNPDAEMEKGTPVTVRVIDVDLQAKKISLSQRLDAPAVDPAASRSQPTQVPSSSPTLRDDRFQRPARDDRFQRPARDERPSRDERPRGPRVERIETYTAGDDAEQAFTGDATVEDLQAKFNPRAKNDRRRRPMDDDEDQEARGGRRPTRSDAIRRTLQPGEDD
jgi:ribosomal protein S1